MDKEENCHHFRYYLCGEPKKIIDQIQAEYVAKGKMRAKTKIIDRIIIEWFDLKNKKS